MTATERVRSVKAAAKPKPGFDKGAFYRLCRMLHAYLSAFAFLTLMFFSATGLLIDHPEWLQGRGRETEVKLTLPAAVMADARKASEPGKVLAGAVARATPLVGAYRSAEVLDGQADLRFQGVKGASTVTVDMQSGKADVSIERSTALTVIGDLHRGKNASVPWRAVIDISAILVLALSVIGYVLFFSLRVRLKTSLILTAVSLGALAAVFVWLTP